VCIVVCLKDILTKENHCIKSNLKKYVNNVTKQQKKQTMKVVVVNQTLMSHHLTYQILPHKTYYTVHTYARTNTKNNNLC